MRNRLLPVVVSASLVVIAGAVVTASFAAAEVNCTPTIVQSSVHFTPKTSALAAKGTTKIGITATIKAPCGQSNASDLFAEVGLSPVDFEHNLEWAVSSDVMPTGLHTYQLKTTVEVKASKIYNVDAPTWDGYVGVIDTDDPGEWGLTTYSDPVPVIIRRAAKVTGNATPEPVKKGKIITVTGALTRANWDTGHNQPYGKQPVKLQFRTPAGTYATVKTVHSSTSGKITAKVKAKKDGYYRYLFSGTATTARTVSTGDYVNVK